MRILVIIVAVIVVAALVFTYVMMFLLNSYGAEEPYTPPPDGYGTSGDYDDSTLTFPGDEVRSIKKDKYINKVSKTTKTTYGENHIANITALRWRVIQVTLE